MRCSKDFQSISRFVLVILGAGACCVNARATIYMNENLSTYYDGYFDGQNVYGYGSVNAGLSYHQHEMEVTITSPLGRVAQGYASYASGTVQWTELLSWNNDDYGDYGIQFQILGYCTLSFVYFQGPYGYVGVRPTPPPCTSQSNVTCSESNGLAPSGHPTGNPRCKPSTMCCTGNDLNPVNGFCLIETCSPCYLKTSPLLANCYQSDLTCEKALAVSFCLNLSTCNGK